LSFHTRLFEHSQIRIIPRAYYESALSKQAHNGYLYQHLMPFTEHLQHPKLNKDNLNSFADRIARLKKSLTSLLSQQAVQHPGKHADVLAQIESRLAKNRVFYYTNEEIAEAFLSKQLKQGGEASVRLI
jgi:hypothetical protein